MLPRGLQHGDPSIHLSGRAGTEREGKSMVRLRPHHLLCIQLFTGRGYDERFTAHMKNVIRELEADTGVLVTEGCDEICSQCPNRTGDGCDSGDRVLQLDRRVLESLGTDCGRELRWKDAAASVHDRILKTNVFDAICSECEWYALCRHIRERGKERKERHGE